MPVDLFQSTTACRCDQCSPDPLPTYTRRHFLECEARHLANFKARGEVTANERRTAYLGGVFELRGEAAYAALRRAVWAEMHRMGVTP